MDDVEVDEPSSAGPGQRHRRGLAAAVALAVVGVALGGAWLAFGGRGVPVAHADEGATTTAAPVVAPEVTVATTAAPQALAPLTGAAVSPEVIARPAIVSKIDAVVAAMPQTGLHQADIVVEVRVEGANRYLAVWHSQTPEVIGPHRSARTTDLDLLSMFVKPLFAYSGGNAGVLSALADTPWKVDLSHSRAESAFFRSTDRRMPHNLMARTADLRTHDSQGAIPVPVFAYHRPGQAPASMPAAEFDTTAGAGATFRWDGDLAAWRREVHGREHVDVSGAPVAPVNVVVLATPYGVSAADANSPEALTVGGGRAWVFSGGGVRSGTWARPDRTLAWDLRDDDGAVMTLEPGQTWVVLATAPPAIRN